MCIMKLSHAHILMLQTLVKAKVSRDVRGAFFRMLSNPAFLWSKVDISFIEKNYYRASV